MALSHAAHCWNHLDLRYNPNCRHFYKLKIVVFTHTFNWSYYYFISFTLMKIIFLYILFDLFHWHSFHLLNTVSNACVRWGAIEINLPFLATARDCSPCLPLCGLKDSWGFMFSIKLLATFKPWLSLRSQILWWWWWEDKMFEGKHFEKKGQGVK